MANKDKSLSRRKFLKLGAVSALALIWVRGALVEPYLDLECVNVRIKVPKWNKGLENIKIALIGDIHAGWGELEDYRVRSAIDTLNAGKPDVVIILGDYFNGRFYQTAMGEKRLAYLLSRIRAPYGVYAVLGNHDTYYGIPKIRRMLAEAGVKLLENSNVEIKTPHGNFYIAGIADPITTSYMYGPTLRGIPPDEPVVFVTHSPGILREIPKTVSFSVAGHTHGGQICLPFFGPIASNCELPRGESAGLIEDSAGRVIYVNRGLGTSRIPLRILCPPEITFITVEKK